MNVFFESKFFEKRKFENRTIKKYFDGALRDFKIANENEYPEVIFRFAYDSLLKIGVALIASMGHRVKSRQGHHVKILEKVSQILADKDIEAIGEAMRKKRNLDLYDGGIIISEKEAKEYMGFVKTVIVKADKFFKDQKTLF